MLFNQEPFEINGHAVSAETLEGMTRFPPFYEPFLRLTDTQEKEKRNKCFGSRVAIPDVDFAVTEKIDGSNCQVIGWQDSLGNNHMLIRSRTELCAYPGDHIWRDSEGIVPVVMPYTDHIERYMFAQYPRTPWSLCMEIYGSGVNKNSGAYGPNVNVRIFGCRLFDDSVIDLFLKTPREKYDALRRVNEHSAYLPWDNITAIAEGIGMKAAPLLEIINSKSIQTPEDAILLLAKYRVSKTAVEDGGDKVVEGLVLWSRSDYIHPDQGKVMAVFKVKFADYPAQMENTIC